MHSFSIRLKYRSIDRPRIGKTAGQFSNKDIHRSGQDTLTYSDIVHSTVANNQNISEKSKFRGCDVIVSPQFNSLIPKK